ncbi:hypothetical protein AB0C28_07055 [Nonomuraea sp. NPDC048892]|uniref:hypothetical protein n=1 Tax=Nonomuraea sp. NPDC048892 TaxID=3154624 RepID=UPI0033ECEFAE
MNENELEVRTGRFGQELSRILGESSRADRIQILVDHVGWLVGEEGDWPWVGELARVAKSAHLTLAEVRDVSSEVAWRSRQAGEEMPPADLAPDKGIDAEVFGIVLAYVRGQRFRFDFRFQELYSAAEEWRRIYPDDALMCAFGAFAACGLRLPDGLSLFRASVEAADADKVSRHVSLTAAWMAQYLPEQATLILELAGRMITLGEGDAVLYFRRARGHSRLGQYERALDDIYRAMDLLGSGQTDVHADYVREWQIICAEMAMEQKARDLATEVVAKAREEAEARVKAAEAMVSDGLARVVEILGLFVTLVTFAVGGGALLLMRTTNWTQGLTTVAIIGGGSLGFFMLLRWVVWAKRRRI